MRRVGETSRKKQQKTRDEKSVEGKRSETLKRIGACMIMMKDPRGRRHSSVAHGYAGHGTVPPLGTITVVLRLNIDQLC
jgi:hypothetical protein